jgi:ketosteroid isomerase-like protein
VKPGFEAMDLDITVHVEEAKVYGDLGVTRSAYTMKMTPKGGGEEIVAEPDGKALTLLERQSDGSWKITYDCFNTNVSPSQE